MKDMSMFINDLIREEANFIKLVQIKDTDQYFGHYAVKDKVLMTNKSKKINIELNCDMKITLGNMTCKTSKMSVKGISSYYNRFDFIFKGCNIELYSYNKELNKNMFK